MLHIIRQLLDVIFPPAAPVEKIKNCTPESFLQFYQPDTSCGRVTLSAYSSPYIQAAIISNKFHQCNHAAILLGTLLTHWLKNLPNSNYVIIPIPLSKRRIRERGYNQVTKIITHASLPPHVTLNEQILSRARNTKAQSHLGRTERLHNIDGAFVCTPDPTLARYHFILLDDVMTTGATLKAAHATLRAHYPQSVILCVALAH